jgi:hypothetical protein
VRVTYLKINFGLGQMLLGPGEIRKFLPVQISNWIGPRAGMDVMAMRRPAPAVDQILDVQSIASHFPD